MRKTKNRIENVRRIAGVAQGAKETTNVFDIVWVFSKVKDEKNEDRKKCEQYETNVYELQQKIYYQIKFLTGDIALSVRFSRSLFFLFHFRPYCYRYNMTIFNLLP